MELESKIAHRTILLAKKLGIPCEKKGIIMDIEMDIDACHNNGCPLKLTDLLNADDQNFAHDVFGIRANIDRTTGKLLNCFLPRFAQ